MYKSTNRSESLHYSKETLDSKQTFRATSEIKQSNPNNKKLIEVELKLPSTLQPITCRPARNTYICDKYGNMHLYQSEVVTKKKESVKQQAKSRIVSFRRELNDFVDLQHKNKKKLISKLGKDLFSYKNSWVHEDYKYNEELLRLEKLKQVKSTSSNNMILTINSSMKEVKEEDESSKSRHQSLKKLNNLKLSDQSVGGSRSIDIDTRMKFAEERLKVECKFNQHKKILNLLNKSGKINNIYSKVQQEIYGNTNSFFKAKATKKNRQKVVSFDFNNNEPLRASSKSQKKLFSNNVLVTELQSKQLNTDSNSNIIRDESSYNNYLQVDPNMFINTEIEFLISQAAKQKDEKKKSGTFEIERGAPAILMNEREDRVIRRRKIVYEMDNSLNSLSYDVSTPDLDELKQHIEHKAFKALGRRVDYKNYNSKYHYIPQIVQKSSQAMKSGSAANLLQNSASLNKILSKSKSKDVLIMKSKYLIEKLNKAKHA